MIASAEPGGPPKDLSPTQPARFVSLQIGRLWCGAPIYPDGRNDGRRAGVALTAAAVGY